MHTYHMIAVHMVIIYMAIWINAYVMITCGNYIEQWIIANTLR